MLVGDISPKNGDFIWEILKSPNFDVSIRNQDWLYIEQYVFENVIEENLAQRTLGKISSVINILSEHESEELHGFDIIIAEHGSTLEVIPGTIISVEDFINHYRQSHFSIPNNKLFAPIIICYFPAVICTGIYFYREDFVTTLSPLFLERSYFSFEGTTRIIGNEKSAKESTYLTDPPLFKFSCSSFSFSLFGDHDTCDGHWTSDNYKTELYTHFDLETESQNFFDDSAFFMTKVVPSPSKQPDALIENFQLIDFEPDFFAVSNGDHLSVSEPGLLIGLSLLAGSLGWLRKKK